MFSRASFFTGEKDHTVLGDLKLPTIYIIWFGSGPSVFLRYPLGVYAATCRSWIGMKAWLYQSCKLGCRGMHTIRMVLSLLPSEFNNRVWRPGESTNRVRATSVPCIEAIRRHGT